MRHVQRPGSGWSPAGRAVRRMGVAFAALGLSLAATLQPVLGDNPPGLPSATPVSVSAVCDGTHLAGDVVTVMSSAPGSAPVDATVALEYLSSNLWLSLSGSTVSSSAVVAGSSSWAFPYAISLAGLPAETTTLRAVVSVTHPEILGGETVIAYESLASAAAVCPVVAPAPDDAPWTMRYSVRLGDTLATIANRYGIPVSAIAAANDIASDSQLLVGQSLVIPAPPTPPAAPGGIGLGVAASRTATPRVVAPVVENTPTPAPTHTPTVTPTETPTPTATPVPAGAALGAGDAPTGANGPDGSSTPATEGSNPFAFLESTVLFALAGVVGVVLLVGSFLGFRIWRERRAGDATFDDDIEPVVRPLRAPAAAAAPPPQQAASPVATADGGAAGEDDADDAGDSAETDDDDDEESPLPPSLRDVFAKPGQRSAVAELTAGVVAPTASDVLNDAESLIRALRERRAG